MLAVAYNTYTDINDFLTKINWNIGNNFDSGKLRLKRGRYLYKKNPLLSTFVSGCPLQEK